MSTVTTVGMGTKRTNMIRSSRRRRFRRLAWLVLGLAVAGAGAQNSAPAATSAGQTTTSAPAMRLDAGDLLGITEFGSPELAGKFRVDARGYVSMPVGGAVPVQGLTAEQAGTAVERFLGNKGILKNPHAAGLGVGDAS